MKKLTHFYKLIIMNKKYRHLIIYFFITILHISTITAFGMNSSVLPLWGKTKVGTTRIIVDSPGEFSANTNTPPHDAGVKVVSFILMSETNAYSVTEHFGEEGDFLLDKSADAYLQRSKSRNSTTTLIKNSKLNIQGREAIRLDTKCTIQGNTLLLTWIGINEIKFSWVIEAHYLDNPNSKLEAERLLASIAIAEPPKNNVVSSESEKWDRVRIGDTHVTAIVPDLFKLNPNNVNLGIEGLKSTSSYYCIAKDEAKHTFNITEGQLIDGYDFAAQQTVNRMYVVFKNNSKDCRLVGRFKSTIAGREAIVSVLSMNLDGLPYESTYAVFHDKAYVWVARATMLVKFSDQKYASAAEFLASIKIEQ